MDVLEAIQGRASTRAFIDKPVTPETLRQLLDTARWAPSGVNTQPWRVAVATGQTKQRIGDRVIQALENEQKPNPDFTYYTTEFPEPYISRQRACGYALYNALGIQREDYDRRKEQWYKNYHSFGAPVSLYILIDGFLQVGSWVDTGMFIQNVMLAARGLGLETCPQASLSEFPDIVREELGINEDKKVICGIAVGYADYDDPVNNYRTEREPVESFTTWHD
ncbi:MAG: nitroreductase [Planctomycetota bacterium]|jgi:nitroreductase